MQKQCLLLACAAVRMGSAADLDLNLAPPGTKAVFGARVKGIADAPLFKAAARGKPQLVEDWAKLVAFTGFDPLRDIDEVIIVAPTGDRPGEGLVILRGRFNVERMAAGAALYRDVPLLGKGDTSVLALLDAETAIAGNRAVVRAAIDRRGQPAVLEERIAARVQSLRDRFDLWGFGDQVEGLTPSGIGKEWSSLDRFEFGVRMTDGFEIAAELHSREPRDAEKMAASIGSVGELMGAGGAKAPKLNVEVKDGAVKFSIAIPADQMKEMIATQVANASRSGFDFPSSATTPSAPPVKSGPPVIVGGEAPDASATAPASAKPSWTTVFVLPGKK
ncbi:MAG: hypothetical protein ABI759_17280 [Candidatus Solibacter sp.]